VKIQEGRGVRPHPKEKGVAEIHLAGKTGQEIPTGCKNRKDACQDEDTEQIRVLCYYGQKKEGQKEKEDDNPAWENEHLTPKDGVKLFQIKTKKTHAYLSSSKETPKRPSGLIKSTKIIMDSATEPLR